MEVFGRILFSTNSVEIKISLFLFCLFKQFNLCKCKKSSIIFGLRSKVSQCSLSFISQHQIDFRSHILQVFTHVWRVQFRIGCASKVLIKDFSVWLKVTAGLGVRCHDNQNNNTLLREAHQKGIIISCRFYFNPKFPHKGSLWSPKSKTVTALCIYTVCIFPLLQNIKSLVNFMYISACFGLVRAVHLQDKCKLSFSLQLKKYAFLYKEELVVELMIV